MCPGISHRPETVEAKRAQHKRTSYFPKENTLTPPTEVTRPEPNVVLFQFSFNTNFVFEARDENNNNKQGTYVIGLLRGTGVPFNQDMVKRDKNALVNACSIPQLLVALDHALMTTRKKEVEFGYDAIWSIGK